MAPTTGDYWRIEKSPLNYLLIAKIIVLELAIAVVSFVWLDQEVLDGVSR